MFSWPSTRIPAQRCELQQSVPPPEAQFGNAEGGTTGEQTDEWILQLAMPPVVLPSFWAQWEACRLSHQKTFGKGANGLIEPRVGESRHHVVDLRILLALSNTSEALHLQSHVVVSSRHWRVRQVLVLALPIACHHHD